MPEVTELNEMTIGQTDDPRNPFCAGCSKPPKCLGLDREFHLGQRRCATSEGPLFGPLGVREPQRSLIPIGASAGWYQRSVSRWNRSRHGLLDLVCERLDAAALCKSCDAVIHGLL